MAADQERADRIRQVRRDKHLRWKQIAAYVGVEMRSAQMWQETGAISWDNAQKLAELAEVDPHWLMSGANTKTPDLLDGPLAGDSQLDRIEALLQANAQRLEEVAADAQHQREELLERINALSRQADAQTTKALAAAVEKIGEEFAARQALAAGQEDAAPVAQGSSRRRSRQAQSQGTSSAR